MTTYRLHYFPESGNSYKLALMLNLCGQTFEPVWTDFGGGITRKPEWRASVNAMGEIPVLEEDGQRLTQTAPILLRLAERYGRFGGRSDDGRFEGLRWLFWLIPFWILMLPFGVEGGQNRRWVRWLSLAALFVSVLSVGYAMRFPWSHPWFVDLIERAGLYHLRR